MESPEVISDALAGHVHQVQVRAHDEINNESQWSDWSPLLLVRPWEGQTGSSPSEDLQQASSLPRFLISVHATPQPTEDATEHDVFTFQPKPESSTAKMHCEFMYSRPVSRSNETNKEAEMCVCVGACGSLL